MRDKSINRYLHGDLERAMADIEQEYQGDAEEGNLGRD